MTGTTGLSNKVRRWIAGNSTISAKNSWKKIVNTGTREENNKSKSTKD